MATVVFGTSTASARSPRPGSWPALATAPEPQLECSRPAATARSRADHHALRRQRRAAHDRCVGQPSGHLHGGVRADQRHGLHVHGDRDQRHRDEPGVRAEQPDHAQPAASGPVGPADELPDGKISSILMDNGNFLFWTAGSSRNRPRSGIPASPTNFTTINAPDRLLCDGAAQLPDGRIIVIGGYGGYSRPANRHRRHQHLRPATYTWTRVADMHLERWYPTLTELADGRYVAISGNSSDPSHWADTQRSTTREFEHLDAAVRGLDTASARGGVSLLLPCAQRQRLHHRAVGGRTFFLMSTTRRGPRSGQSGILNGSSVMYLPGKILYSGGAAA